MEVQCNEVVMSFKCDIPDCDEEYHHVTLCDIFNEGNPMCIKHRNEMECKSIKIVRADY